MQEEPPSREQLLLQIQRQHLELQNLRREKADLEILLETTTAHADMVDALLYESNQKLQAEVIERLRAEAAIKSFLDLTIRDRDDLEILLDTITEHGDMVGYLLQNKADSAVREGERRLAQFLEAVPVGVFVVDASGKAYYANQKAIQLLGKGIAPEATVEQLVEVYQIYIAGTDRPYPTAQMPLVRALNGETVTADDLALHQVDKVVPLEVWATPITDEMGNVVYAIAAFQDITERKQAEAEREKVSNQLYQLNKAYERFVPRQFLQLLKKDSILDVQLGDQVQKEMSVLFADIRNFTTLSEGMNPEDNFKFINAYLSRMEPAIVKNNGFIDKYIGDAIMALFNGSADDAVQAGISMLQILAEYNTTRTRPERPPIDIGIGINTGSLMLGTVGGQNHMDSTVISDAVNLASRIEGLTKEYGISLLISHQTFWELEDYNQYGIRIIDWVKVRGKSDLVAVYEVFDADPPETKQGKLATKTTFADALLLYNLGIYGEATRLFGDCLHKTPMDKVSQVYLKRSQQHCI